MKATSWGLVEQVKNAPIINFSGPATTCSVRAKPSTSMNSLTLPSRSSPYSRAMIETRGCHPPQSIWPSIGVGSREAVPYFFFLGKKLHRVARWDREPKAFAGHRMLTGGNPVHLGCQTRFLYIRRELLQGGRGVDTPAHVIHARVSRLA